MAANPTWDGRGVTIGIVDTGSSLDHPSLLTTSMGERKIIDWVTGTDPFTDNDPTWLNMQNLVRGRIFQFNGVSYLAPANKEYQSDCSTSVIPAWVVSSAGMLTGTAIQPAATGFLLCYGTHELTRSMWIRTKTTTSAMKWR
jgi:subtilisin family serine protease